MQKAKNKHTPVLAVNGSWNHQCDIKVNTIAPTEKPNSLDGHILPSKCATMCLTESMYRYDNGTPIKDITNGLAFIHSYLNCPCSCTNVITCANIPYNNPVMKSI